MKILWQGAATRIAMIKVGSLAIALVASVLYARALGASGYGEFAFAMAISGMLAVPASLGLPAYILKLASVTPEDARAILKWADRKGAHAGCLAAAVLCLFAALRSSSAGYALLAIAAPLPLLSLLAASRQSILQARGCLFSSQWPALLLAPMTTFILALLTWLACGQISPSVLMMITVFSTLVSLLASHWMLKPWTQVGAPAAHKHPPRLRDALPFMWIGTLFLINSRTDLVILGVLSGSTATGHYAIAARLAELTGFFLVTSNTVIAPRIAQLHSTGQTRPLQALLTRSTNTVALATIPIIGAFILAPKWLLVTFFGPQFIPAVLPLQILVVGQVFNVLSGPTGLLLNMTGHAGKTTIALGASALMNVALNLVLAPRFGANGSALSTALSFILWNSLLLRWNKKLLGISPAASFPLLWGRTKKC